MTKQKYTRVSKGAAGADSKKPCGSQHPLHPELRCMAIGECVVDSHIGKIGDEIVVWGQFFEDEHPGFPKSSFRVIPLREG